MPLTYTEAQWDAREVAKAKELYNLTQECNASVAAAEKDRYEKVRVAQKTSEDYGNKLNSGVQMKLSEMTDALSAAQSERDAAIAELAKVKELFLAGRHDELTVIIKRGADQVELETVEARAKELREKLSNQ